MQLIKTIFQLPNTFSCPKITYKIIRLKHVRHFIHYSFNLCINAPMRINEIQTRAFTMITQNDHQRIHIGEFVRFYSTGSVNCVV